MYQNQTTREIATTIHRWVNERRQQRGLDQVKGRADLNRAAERHSRRMADAGEATHAVGSGIGSRTSRFNEVGENVYRVSPVRSARDVARRALDFWMTSDGHRQNILDRDARLDGVGVHVRGRTAFVTHIFASRRRAR